MKRRSILILDSQWNCGLAWKKQLGRTHEIAAFWDFSIVATLCRKGIVDLILLNIHNARKEFDYNIFRRMRQAFPSIPVIMLIPYRCALKTEDLEPWGITNSLRKPFLPKTLEEAIEETLNERAVCGKL